MLWWVSVFNCTLECHSIPELETNWRDGEEACTGRKSLVSLPAYWFSSTSWLHQVDTSLWTRLWLSEVWWAVVWWYACITLYCRRIKSRMVTWCSTELVLLFDSPFANVLTLNSDSKRPVILFLKHFAGIASSYKPCSESLSDSCWSVPRAILLFFSLCFLNLRCC